VVDDVTFKGFFVFCLDRLPATFANKLSHTEDKTVSRQPLDDAVSSLKDVICNVSGHQFWRNKVTTLSDDLSSFRYSFYCCQDEGKARPQVDGKSKLRKRMARFRCESLLSFKINGHDRTLEIQMRHVHHAANRRFKFSDEALEIIDEKIESTPSEIYRCILDSGLPDAELVEEHHVYYRWQLANRHRWHLDDDAFKSAQMLLADNSDAFHAAEFCQDNVRAIGIYCLKMISALKGSTTEVAIDATYGTNQNGSDLYSVIAEEPGVHVPWCPADR
jgi:hypothetical protein